MNIFKDRVAFVTGGGSGLGRALCGELSRMGAITIVADVNKDSSPLAAHDITGRDFTCLQRPSRKAEMAEPTNAGDGGDAERDGDGGGRNHQAVLTCQQGSAGTISVAATQGVNSGSAVSNGRAETGAH
jgi:NAD(P)-dependent dehydrogenase (short-subunit alcohol dehydrogenase family)